LPLTEDGNRREVIQQMFRRLQEADKKDLLAISYRIAVLKLKEIDQQWLKEMFMSVENIFEGTWMYDEIHQKGVKQGLEQGLEQGVKQGLEQGLQAQRALLLSFVKTHFPDEFTLANQQVGLIMTLPQAQELIDRLFVARTDGEVKAILLSIPHA
jgi:predicted transposase YdaD